MSIEQ